MCVCVCVYVIFNEYAYVYFTLARAYIQLPPHVTQS